jgi:hypothetical protein
MLCRRRPVVAGRKVRVKCVQGPPAELRVRLVQAAYEAAVAEGRYEAPKARRAPSRARLYRDGKLTLLAPYFDYAYYAFENPDFSASGLDELEHFNFFGWRSLRNPAAWFDTAYYLASNPDVLASGDNPFWHYIFKGRAEGRATRRPRAAERAILDALAPPEARAAEAPPPDLPRLGAEDLAARLEPRLAGAEGLLYCVDPSGTVASPVSGFLRLHASPLRSAQALKALPAAWSQTRLALDGEELGLATDAVIAKALSALGEALPPRRVLAVRGLLGASLEGLLAVEAALAAQRKLFFLDDFSSLCASPRLLRNDVAFCGAPPPESEACAVCVYGESRRAALSAVERLFERCRFTVVAPSQEALAFWRDAAALPHDAAIVSAPARLEDAPGSDLAAEAGEIGVEGRPVRVAFLGPPTLPHGWPTFARILEACGELVAYAFHHFAAAEALRPSRNLVSLAVEGPLRDLLIARRIDLVVVANEGCEPFSNLALEALAAGCDLVTLAHSGHPAALVGSERRGRAFAADDEVVEFFTSGKAIVYARERDRFPRFVQAVRREDVLSALVG